jgi:hypothetical protein
VKVVPVIGLQATVLGDRETVQAPPPRVPLLHAEVQE